MIDLVLHILGAGAVAFVPALIAVGLLFAWASRSQGHDQGHAAAMLSLWVGPVVWIVSLILLLAYG